MEETEMANATVAPSPSSADPEKQAFTLITPKHRRLMKQDSADFVTNLT